MVVSVSYDKGMAVRKTSVIKSVVLSEKNVFCNNAHGGPILLRNNGLQLMLQLLMLNLSPQTIER